VTGDLGETPKAGGKWLGNAEIFEANRLTCAKAAANAVRRGDPVDAHFWELRVATWRKRRDAEQKAQERLLLNRRSPLWRRRLP